MQHGKFCQALSSYTTSNAVLVRLHMIIMQPDIQHMSCMSTQMQVQQGVRYLVRCKKGVSSHAILLPQGVVWKSLGAIGKCMVYSQNGNWHNDLHVGTGHERVTQQAPLNCCKVLASEFCSGSADD